MDVVTVMDAECDREAALEVIREVLAWYALELYAERSRMSPDVERVRVLMDGLKETALEGARAYTLEDGELAKMGAEYAEKLRALNAG